MKLKSRELRQNLTNEERKLWSYLRNRQFGCKFIRQYVFDDKYILDFYCAEKMLVIELDGGQHCENEKDVVRYEYLRNRGCKILRFWNNEIQDNLFGCLEVVKSYLDEGLV